MTKTEMSSVELVRELVEFFGARRAASILGLCTLLALAGVKDRAGILAAPVLAVETRYRLLGDIRRFRQVMAVKGYADSDPDEFEMVRRLSDVRARG